MTISDQSGMSLLESALSAQQTRQDVGILMLKKAQDTSKQEADALLQGIEQSAQQADGSTFNAYA